MSWKIERLGTHNSKILSKPGEFAVLKKVGLDAGWTPEDFVFSINNVDPTILNVEMGTYRKRCNLLTLIGHIYPPNSEGMYPDACAGLVVDLEKQAVRIQYKDGHYDPKKEKASDKFFDLSNLFKLIEARGISTSL